VLGTPWVASCTVTVESEEEDVCSAPEGAEHLTHAAVGEAGTREFFTHVRFHKHEDEQIVVYMLVELYAQSGEEATWVLEEAARGDLAITSLAEESRPPAAGAEESPHSRAPSPEPSPISGGAMPSRRGREAGGRRDLLRRR
jgi:hypothetical protein